MLLFYVMSLVITLVAHLYYGNRDFHTAPPGFILPVLFTIMGFLWLYIDLLIVRLKFKKTKLVVHTIGLAINVLIILLIIVI